MQAHGPILNNRGYLYGLGAAAAFVIMVTLVKLCRDAGLSSRSIVFYRSFVVLPFCFVLCRHMTMKVSNLPLLMGRCIFGFAAMVSAFAAMRWITVVEMNLLFNLQPLLVAAVAPLILGAGERADARTMLALIAALVGSTFVIGPELSSSPFHVTTHHRWIGLGLGAIGAGCGAIAHSCLRGLQQTPAIVTVTWFQVSVALLALLPFDGAPLNHPPFSDVLSIALIGVGISAFLGQLCLTKAYQCLPAVRASALGYSAPVFGVVMDLIVFASLPAPHTIIGGLIIVSSGLWWLQPSIAETDDTTSSDH